MKGAACRGLSLLELLVTIAVMGILLSVALPSFKAFIEETRSAGVTDDFYYSLQLARSEAVKRAVRVKVCPSSNGSTCTGGTDWNAGWIVRYPAEGSTFEVLKVQGAVNSAVVIETPESDMVFMSVGQAAAGAAVQVSVGDAQVRYICLELSGRAEVKKGEDCDA